jgi:biopolymer transport protein ExbD
MASNLASADADGDLGFQIAPMVDVVFVLMLFFMASAGLQVTEKELGINLPSGRVATGKDEPITPILVQIGSDGQVLINSQSFDTPESADLPATREQLKLLMSYGGKDPVIIQPAPDVRQERVVQVLNAAAAAGVKNLSFG